MATTIQLEGNVKKELTAMKIHAHETYNEVVMRLIHITKEETEQELSSETIDSIQKSLDDIKASRTVSHESVKKKLKLR